MAVEGATAAGTDRQGTTKGQSGILAQLCDVQGVPSSICIIGEVTAVTAAYVSWAGATIIVASVKTKPNMPNNLLIRTCLPGWSPSRKSQFAERRFAWVLDWTTASSAFVFWIEPQQSQRVQRDKNCGAGIGHDRDPQPSHPKDCRHQKHCLKPKG